MENEEKRQVNELTVIEMDKEFVKSTREFEQYALCYSKAMSKLFQDEDSGPESFQELDLERFVVLENPQTNKRVFRKSAARNGVKSNQIAIGYRTQKEIGVKNGEKITVGRANWIQYYWHNSVLYEKAMFFFAFISLLCGVLSLIIQLAQIIGCGLCG